MTGISKNLYKFSSLLAVVAMFLGLMVTGCSEGDNAPDKEILYDASKTKLDVVVGVADAADAKVAQKGYELPADVAELVVKLMTLDELVPFQENAFAETEVGDVAAWIRQDNKITMPIAVDKEDVDMISSVVVTAYDGEGNFLGAYCWDGASLNAPVDFTRDDAPAYQTAEVLAEASALMLTTDPEAAEDGVVSVEVGDTVTVTGEVVIALSENTSIEEEVADDALVLTLAEDTTALTIEGNVVTAVEATEEAVEVLAAYGDLNASFDVMVEGEAPVDELTLTADAEQIAVGETAQLTAMYGEEDVTSACTFETSDEAIATVDEAGLVTGVADGEATITASYQIEGEEEAKTAEITITVGEVVGGLQVSADPEEIAVDETSTLTAMYGDADVTEDCTFEIAEGSEEFVSIEGNVVTGIAAGEATIVATYEAEGEEEPATAEVTITVTGDEPTSELTVAADPEEIAVDETSTLTATYGEEDVTEACTFEITEGEELVTIEGNVVTGVAAGEVTITATYTPEEEGAEAVTAEVTITVTGEPAEELTASADSEEIDITGTAQITAKYGEDDVTADCTFESSDDTIATVDEAGVVTGVAEGEVTITVSYTPEGAEEAVTAEVMITVISGE